MKLFACIRTLNEADHIEDFCKCYSFVDRILIADGGSTDNTVLLAEQFPNVTVKNYLVKVECRNGIWRNPDGPHIQFLIDWAEAEGADWIIFQDCDHRLNINLKRDLYGILESCKKDFIFATQIFMWKQKQWFPDMSVRNDKFMAGLLGWRANRHIKIINAMPHFGFSFDGKTMTNFSQLEHNEVLPCPPYCFMHFGWDTDEMVAKQVGYYRTSGLIPNMIDPKDMGGIPASLEEWMVE